MAEVDVLRRQLARERAARKSAESILEEKSRELFEANRALTASQVDLEARVEARTAELEAANRGLKGAQESLLSTMDDLRAATTAAEAASQAKTGFLANMSHEIRTPLNAIVGFAELLRSAQDVEAEERDEWTSMIHTSAAHLVELVNDILDLSKIESGRLELERCACSPAMVFGDVVSMQHARAKEQGIELELEYASAIPAAILTDPTRLRQVLMNLIGNAIKFTTEGAVKVQVAAAEAGTLSVKIIDSGVGIPASKIDSIFDAFVQADQTTTRLFGGTGLGLAISKQLVDQLGGDLRVESEEGVGSTFSFSIATGSLDCIEWIDDPIGVANARRRRAAEQFGNEGEGLYVLVVDDAQVNRRLLGTLLSRSGARVEFAENGKIAVESALEKPFDVVFMDMQMPVLDGYDASRELRRQKLECPIVAVTAHAMRGEQEKCIEAGCSHYISKPVDRGKLLSLLAELNTKTACV